MILRRGPVESQRGMSRWALMSGIEGTCGELWKVHEWRLRGLHGLGYSFIIQKKSFDHLLYARHCTGHRK